MRGEPPISAPVPAITGPTSSGKTALSIPVAGALSAEIISMDSRQVYRGMDVGTDKVAPENRARVPHHGLDLVDPHESYSAGRFARDARRWIREIRERRRVPLLAGGTGFFLKALTDPIFQEPGMDRARRERLRRWMEGQSVEELARWAQRLDPARAQLARSGGPQRLSRTLEVALLTGRPLSWWHETAPPEDAAVPVRVVLLQRPREELYHRINERARAMFEGGLLEEVEGLLAAGWRRGDPGMTGTGYREAVDVLRGAISLEEAVDRVQRATRRYARRQLTWFRNQLSGDVLYLDATLPLEEQVDQVLRWWRRGNDS